jgi:predicted NBD/HSP70 family sugar kinase
MLVSGLTRDLLRMASELDRSPSGLGIAVGAQVDPGVGRIIGSPYTQWRDVRVAELVRSELAIPDLPVAVLDVARCAALANWREIAADRTVTDLLHLQIGIGAGAGLVTRSDPTHVRLPGPVAHLPLDRSGPRCACGARGCLDAVAGFDALVRLSAGTGITLSTAPDAMSDYCVRLAQAAVSGDLIALRAIEEVGGWLGQAAASVILSTLPSRFTLGGYPALLGSTLLASFSEAVRPHVPWLDEIMINTQLGDNASVFGAYLLAVRQLLSDPIPRRT